MELEQLQQAWKELNERVQQNELVHQQQIREMLSIQKESSLQRIQRFEIVSLSTSICITAIIILLIVILPSTRHLLFQLWSGIVLILGTAITIGFLSCRKITQIRKEENLERQIRNMLQYKRILNRGFFIGIVSVIPFIINFLYYNSHFWPALCIASLIGITIDYFEFHYLANQIKEFSQINKELAELDD